MRSGRYTLRDIGGEDGIRVTGGAQGETRVASCRLTRMDGKVVDLTVNSYDFATIRVDGADHIDEFDSRKIPYYYCEYESLFRELSKKAHGHGGRRRSAGRHRSEGEKKEPHSLRCTRHEWYRIQQLLSEMRAQDSQSSDPEAEESF